MPSKSVQSIIFIQKPTEHPEGVVVGTTILQQHPSMHEDSHVPPKAVQSYVSIQKPILHSKSQQHPDEHEDPHVPLKYAH